MYHYLSIDPGEKNVGWAKFDEKGDTIGLGKIRGMDEFLDWLEADDKPKRVIFENYRVNPAVGHAFSKVRTVELIGNIKRYCYKNNIPFAEQRNTDLPTGLRLIGMYEVYYKNRKRIKHVDDDVSALAHGVFYLTQKNIRKHRLDTT